MRLFGKEGEGLAWLYGTDSSLRHRDKGQGSRNSFMWLMRDQWKGSWSHGPWLMWFHQVPSHGGGLCRPGDLWCFKGFFEEVFSFTQGPLWGHLMSYGNALILPPFQALTHIYRQGHIYKCARRRLNMGNHHFTHNFPTYHCKPTNNCEFSSNFLY